MNGWPFSRTPQLLRKQIETPNYVLYTYADRLGGRYFLSAVAALPARSWFEVARKRLCVRRTDGYNCTMYI